MKNVEDLYPLSPMQEGMLFHALYAPESGAYAVHISFHIEGSLNIPLFKRSWQSLVDRHSILRSALVWEQVNRPLQVVKKQASLAWEEFDWRDRSASDQEEELRKYIREQHRRGFDLAQAPLMRMALMTLSETSYQFVWNYSHIVLDAWSVNILFAELLSHLRAYSNGTAPELPAPRPYREFIAWLQQQDHTRAEEFWRRRLKGFCGPTSLRVEEGASEKAHSTPEYRTTTCSISKAVSLKLQAIARHDRFTMATFIEGAWAYVLGHYCRNHDVVFGITVNGRPVSLKGANEIVGLLVNTLPARVHIHFDERLGRWLKTIHDHQVESREYGFCSLVEIKTWSDVHGAAPLFESLVVFENYPVTRAAQELDNSVRLVGSSLLQNSAYPLSIAAEPNEDGMTLRLHSDTQRFSATETARLLDSVQCVLELMAENPDQTVRELSLINVVRQQLLLQQPEMVDLRNIEYVCELTPMQQQLLHERVKQGSFFPCLAQAVFTVEEEIDPEHLEASLRKIVEQNDALRASVVWKDVSQPAQIVHRDVKLWIKWMDWRHRSSIGSDVAVRELLNADRELGFPLSEAPPFRLTIVRLPDSKCKVVVAYDQFMVDSWSIRKIMSTVLLSSCAANNCQELFTEGNGAYQKWVKKFNEQDGSSAEAFWKVELSNISSPTPLGATLSEGQGPGDTGIANRDLEFSGSLSEKLRNFVAHNDLHITTPVLGAWAILLSRYMGQSDLIIETAVHGNPFQSSTFDNVVGNSMALVPLRIAVHDHDLLLPWLVELQRHARDAFRHAYVPWDRVGKLKSSVAQSLDHIISFENPTEMRREVWWAERLHIDSLSGSFGAAPMTVVVRPDKKISISCVYSKRAFEHWFVEQMLGHFRYLIEQISDNTYEDGEVSLSAGLNDIDVPEMV